MDLIERYVNDVGRRLPRDKRNDVRDELRSSLLDALEARAGAEPSEEEVIALLKEFGHPERAAASYRPARQYLIGPELFPVFKKVAGIVLAALSAVLVGVFIITAVTGHLTSAEVGARLGGLLTGILQSAVTALGAMVVVFAILQRFDVKLQLEAPDWHPSDLAPVHDRDLVGRGEAIFGIVFPATLLTLAHLFRDRIGIVKGPGEELLLNDIFRENLPWISAALLISMTLHALLLSQGRWYWYTRIANVASDLFDVYVLYRIAAGIAGQRDALLEAGLPEPLPVLLTIGTYSIPLIVGFIVVAEAAGMLYRTLSRASWGAGRNPGASA